MAAFNDGSVLSPVHSTQKQYPQISLFDSLNGVLIDNNTPHGSKSPNNLRYTSRLDMLCINYIVQNYGAHPSILNHIPQIYYNDLYNTIDVNSCDINHAIQYIEVQYYWYLRLLSLHADNLYERNQSLYGISHTTDKSHYTKFNKFVQLNTNKVDPDINYKQLYCETHITQLIQSYNEPGIDRLLNDTQPFVPYIHSIQLNKFNTCNRIDLSPLFIQFNQLRQLKLCYKVNNIGMNYQASQFGISMSDIQWLCNYISSNHCSLHTLNLADNQLNDHMLCKLLHDGLNYNHTIHTLNLSHNQLKSEFVTELCHYMAHHQLLNLSLYDNQINTGAATQLVSHVLSNAECKLVSLNLGMNPLSHTGLNAVLQPLINNTVLHTLELNSCSGNNVDTGNKVIELLQQNTTLTYLNITNNQIFDSTTNVDQLITAVQNSKLIKLNISNCGLTSDIQQQILMIVDQKLIQHNNTRKQVNK